MSKADKEYFDTKLNPEEKRVSYKDPFGAKKMLKANNLSFQWGEYYYGSVYGLDDTQANAFRHAMWNAAGTFMIGSKRTKVFTDAHEFRNSGASTNMDYFNNAAGRAIAEEYIKQAKKYIKCYMGLGGWYVVEMNNSFKYYGVTIPVTGDPYANIALMIKTAANQGNGRVLMWIK